MISISDLKEKVLTGGELTEAEAMSLANLNTDEYDELLESAAEITDRFGSRNFDSCSIINGCKILIYFHPPTSRTFRFCISLHCEPSDFVSSPASPVFQPCIALSRACLPAQHRSLPCTVFRHGIALFPLYSLPARHHQRPTEKKNHTTQRRSDK